MNSDQRAVSQNRNKSSSTWHNSCLLLAMLISLITLSLFYVISSLLPAWNAEYWWVRVFDFPRLQLITLGIACLVGIIFFEVPNRQFYPILGLLILGLGMDFYRIVPYLPTRIYESEAAAPNEEMKTTAISFLSANVLVSNRDVDKFIQVLSNHPADVVVLLEPDAWWEEKLRVIEKKYRYQIKVPQDNTYGMLLYSKYPLENTSVEHLTDGEVPAIFTDIVMPDSPNIRLYALHPRPPRPQEGDSDKRDAELLQVASLIEKKDIPTIVMGDLNDVAWSHTSRLFQRISGLLDPRRGRGTYNTYPVGYPFFRYPLDHVFHSKHFYFSNLTVLPDIGSDHFPIFAKFDLANSSAPKQEEVAQEEGDQKEAEELKARAGQARSQNTKNR